MFFEEMYRGWRRREIRRRASPNHPEENGKTVALAQAGSFEVKRTWRSTHNEASG